MYLTDLEIVRMPYDGFWFNDCILVKSGQIANSAITIVDPVYHIVVYAHIYVCDSINCERRKIIDTHNQKRSYSMERVSALLDWNALQTEGSFEFHFLSKKPPRENRTLSCCCNITAESGLTGPDKQSLM